MVNGCVHCAPVHAGRYIALTKNTKVIRRLFAGEEAGASPRARVIARFTTRLSACPPAGSADDARALRKAGLSDGEILDLFLAVAMFGWTNRLTHPLGEPVAAAG